METAPTDIVVEILSYVSDRTKCAVLSICHKLHKHLHSVKFTDMIDLRKIQTLPFIHNFTNVCVNPLDYWRRPDYKDRYNKLIIPNNVSGMYFNWINETIILKDIHSLYHLGIHSCYSIMQINLPNLTSIKTNVYGILNIAILPNLQKIILYNELCIKEISLIFPELRHFDFFNASTSINVLFKLISPKLEYLRTNDLFNTCLSSCYYPNLTCLDVGNNFNHPISGWNFPNLKILRFGKKFDQEVKGYIPIGLVELKFGYNFSKELDGCLPDSLLILILHRIYRNNFTVPPNCVVTR